MEIKPFKAYRYDANTVGDVSSCITPPYDVINPKQQDAYYHKNPHNIVRIIRGKADDGDNEQNNVYTRAADFLNQWIQSGALKQDADEAIYGYVQDFEIAGVPFQRLSFIALGKLEEFGKIVRPHEQILKKPMQDRLNLLHAAEAQFGLVFMIYEDPDQVADKAIEHAITDTPLIDFTDEMQVRHRLFAITNPESIEAIQMMMNDKYAIIADGHHRYTTALTHSKETDNPNARYLMMSLCNSRHEGLVVLATHRVVSDLVDFDMANLLKALGSDFEITEFHFEAEHEKTDCKVELLEQMKQKRDENKIAFGLYSGTNAFYMIVLNDTSVMDAIVPDKSPAWRTLDVSVLHKLILERVLQIDEAKLAAQTNVEYVKDTPSAIDETIAQIDAGQKQAAFFMNPPKIEQIQQVAEAGERMPQKSTYFFPKMFSGLTIQKL